LGLEPALAQVCAPDLHRSLLTAKKNINIERNSNAETSHLEHGRIQSSRIPDSWAAYIQQHLGETGLRGHLFGHKNGRHQ
jgi:hypothetical protein